MYAEEIPSSSFFLGVGDLAVIADVYELKVTLAYLDDKSPALNLDSLPNIVSQLVQGSHLISEIKPMFQRHEKIDVAKQDVYVMVGCRSDFQIGGGYKLNHWIPSWHRNQIGDDVFEERTGEALSEIASDIEKYEDKLKDMKETDEGYQSTREYITLLNNQLAMWKRLYKHDLYPFAVHADGNCAIWSICCLMNGLYEGKEPPDIPEKDEVLEVRKESWH